ncbi:hypothetical protein [Kribbella sp. NPDC000426]|uniref:hypothetical protein n=1 Tax=Kribbella sp. NPDC000426 TaxID=3154255 RepID=UPI0033333854
MRRIAAAVVLLLVTACSAQTVQPPPATPSVVPVAQASKAALTLADLPKGFEGGVAPDPSPAVNDGIQYEPGDCWVVRNPMRVLGAPASSVRAQYFVQARDPMNNQDVQETISSWTTSAAPLLQRITEGLPGCPTVTGTWVVSLKEPYRVAVRQLSVPGLKDGIVLGAGFANTTFKPLSYSAYVVRGNTLLTLQAHNDTFPTTASFTALLVKAVARLDAVVN